MVASSTKKGAARGGKKGGINRTGSKDDYRTVTKKKPATKKKGVTR